MMKLPNRLLVMELFELKRLLLLILDVFSLDLLLRLHEVKVVVCVGNALKERAFPTSFLRSLQNSRKINNVID